LIEHADRFGLSQLHQLRGRVSRGRVAGQCFLFAAGGNDAAEEGVGGGAGPDGGFALAGGDGRARGGGGDVRQRPHGPGGRGLWAWGSGGPRAVVCAWPAAMPSPWFGPVGVCPRPNIPFGPAPVWSPRAGRPTGPPWVKKGAKIGQRGGGAGGQPAGNATT